jgi:hypothetical protein
MPDPNDLNVQNWLPARLDGRVFLQDFEANFNPFERVEEKVPIKGKHGDELFQLILSGIREIYDVDATVAGGAVRDFAAGILTFKDVDVFVPMKWDEFAFSAPELGWQGQPALLKKGGYGNKGNGDACCVFPTTARGQATVQGRLVDLVFMDSPLSPKEVATFPVYAQRGVWTLNGGTSLAPEAAEDIANRKFTIDPTITDKGRLSAILNKVNDWKQREGYKDWKIVAPESSEWWEEKKETEEDKLKIKINEVYAKYWKDQEGL